ncbi:MAG: ATP-binding cassette domain-containing protein [bacterium]|nr:ATP-binding cassette domain-containing protein [bacterium]
MIISVNGLKKEFVLSRTRPGFWGAVKSFFSPMKTTVTAVNGISFEVEEGELLAFLGPNGAGKSTTIKILTGILHPTSGEVSVLGIVPWQDRISLSRRIGSVFGQKSQLWYHLPPVDTFNLLGKIYEVEDRDFKKRLDRLIELFELDEFKNIPIRKLSLGQRMRCEVMAALLHAPRILFLDEPTIGLDTIARNNMRAFIRRLSEEENVTIFLTSHDTQDVVSICRRAIIINHGGIVIDTKVKELKRKYFRWKTVELHLDQDLGPDFKLPGVTLLKHKKKEDGFGIKLEVDIDAVPVETVIRKIMRRRRLLDITILDPPLEEVVSHIYQKKVE